MPDEVQVQMEKLCDLPNGQPLYYADETFTDPGFYTWDCQRRENVRLSIQPHPVEEGLCAKLDALHDDLRIAAGAEAEKCESTPDPIAEAVSDAYTDAAQKVGALAHPQLSTEEGEGWAKRLAEALDALVWPFAAKAGRCPNFGEVPEECDCIACKAVTLLGEWEDSPLAATPEPEEGSG